MKPEFKYGEHAIIIVPTRQYGKVNVGVPIKVVGPVIDEGGYIYIEALDPYLPIRTEDGHYKRVARILPNRLLRTPDRRNEGGES
jgi:hypothetical protein